MQLKTGAIILARCSSSRFPDKAMTTLADRRLIDHVIDRVRRIHRIDDVVLATSQQASDDKLAAHAIGREVPVFRGSLHNVAYRVLCCARCRGWSHFVRVNGDCPFVDPELIDKAIAALVGSKLDMVTNVMPRTYPYGVSAEAIRTDAMAWAYEAMTDAADFEHVSRYFYRNPDELRIYNMHNPHGDRSDVHLAVDMPENLEQMAKVIEGLSTTPDLATTRELVDVYTKIEAIRKWQTVGA